MSHPFLNLDLVLALLAAHFLGDFVFQTDYIVRHKKRFFVLLFHGLQLAALSYLLAGRWSDPWIPATILVTHGLIDYVKARQRRSSASLFLLDQAAHLLVIVALARAFNQEPALSYWSEKWGKGIEVLWIELVGAIVCVRAGGVLIGLWVSPYLDEIQRKSELKLSGPEVSRGLTNGGRVIGQWERALIFLFVWLGQFGAIGFSSRRNRSSASANSKTATIGWKPSTSRSAPS